GDGLALDADLREAVFRIRDERLRLLLRVGDELLGGLLGVALRGGGGGLRVFGDGARLGDPRGAQLLDLRALLGGTRGCLLQLRGRLVEVLLGGGSGLLLRGRELLLGLVATS